MSQYKLAAFDMDGTLLNSAKEIQPSAAAAFKRAIRAEPFGQDGSLPWIRAEL